jgi:transcription initiation factor TFIIIB Brf1 subunit/transcription initiation factor TFIIB
VKNIKPINTSDLIQRFSNLLEIEEKYIKIALIASSIIEKLGLCQENNPKSVAVGVIYLISQEYDLDLTKKKPAGQTNTSDDDLVNKYLKKPKTP